MKKYKPNQARQKHCDLKFECKIEACGSPAPFLGECILHSQTQKELSVPKLCQQQNLHDHYSKQLKEVPTPLEVNKEKEGRYISTEDKWTKNQKKECD